MRLASVRPAIAGFLAFLAGMGTWVRAEEPVSTLADLRALEEKVRDVTARALPATVSLYSEQTQSSGSGVIVSADGLVLTAAHVVDGMEEVTVVFPDGKQGRAKVLGANRSKDAAMVKLVTKGPWPFVEMGDSKALKVGQFVVSLGHAGGYDARRTPPVRFGRVVGLNPIGFIGTDCALIGGDSGGPLFDLQGKLVGIHSSIGASLMANNHTGVSGFRSDWERLQKGETWGRLTRTPLMNPDRPILGIDVDGSVRGGVRISDVFKDSPAEVAGLKEGDVLRSVDGKAVRNLRALQGILAAHEPGDEVVLEIERRGETLIRPASLARLGDVMGELEE